VACYRSGILVIPKWLDSTVSKTFVRLCTPTSICHLSLSGPACRKTFPGAFPPSARFSFAQPAASHFPFGSLSGHFFFAVNRHLAIETFPARNPHAHRPQIICTCVAMFPWPWSSYPTSWEQRTWNWEPTPVTLGHKYPPKYAGQAGWDGCLRPKSVLICAMCCLRCLWPYIYMVFLCRVGVWLCVCGIYVWGQVVSANVFYVELKDILSTFCALRALADFLS